MNERVQVRVNGRVQGVGFRYYAQHTATALGLSGTVRNLADGGVEAIAEGPESQLKAFVAAMRQGPHAGHVDDASEAWGDRQGEFHGFEVVA